MGGGGVHGAGGGEPPRTGPKSKIAKLSIGVANSKHQIRCLSQPPPWASPCRCDPPPPPFTSLEVRSPKSQQVAHSPAQRKSRPAPHPVPPSPLLQGGGLARIKTVYVIPLPPPPLPTYPPYLPPSPSPPYVMQRLTGAQGGGEVRANAHISSTDLRLCRDFIETRHQTALKRLFPAFAASWHMPSNRPIAVRSQKGSHCLRCCCSTDRMDPDMTAIGAAERRETQCPPKSWNVGDKGNAMHAVRSFGCRQILAPWLPFGGKTLILCPWFPMKEKCFHK